MFDFLLLYIDILSSCPSKLEAIGKQQTANHILRMRSQIPSTPSVWVAHVSSLLHLYQVQAIKLWPMAGKAVPILFLLVAPNLSIQWQRPPFSIHSAHDCDHRVIHQQFNMHNHSPSAHEWLFLPANAKNDFVL
jgi:hypothetical protein